MIRFLMKGLIRDRHRSLFPIIIVCCGTAITILGYCWIMGFRDDMISTAARLDTGHVKIMTRGYEEISSQLPNDFGLSDISNLLTNLKKTYPEMDWNPRIKFAGLLDLPDEKGETRAQGPIFGLGVDLLSKSSTEPERMGLKQALASGRLPKAANEILISHKLAEALGAANGDTATLVSSTAMGSMAIHNFVVVGTVRFGIGSMDRNTIIADLADIQYALDMVNGAGEIPGYFPKDIFREKQALAMADAFNKARRDDKSDFSPVMVTLREQNDLGSLLDLTSFQLMTMIIVFVFVMSIVLWNTGLMSGLRRYGEIGVRLAMGEDSVHIYKTMIYESLLVGLVGSMLGAVVGLTAAWYLQEYGLDITDMMQASTMMMSNVMRAKITVGSFFIGFVPGLAATLLGAAIAGIGIFRRSTAQLFKELEA